MHPTTAPAQIRTICSWCLSMGRMTVITEGELDASGRCSHGLCSACADDMRARIDAARRAIVVKEQPEDRASLGASPSR